MNMKKIAILALSLCMIAAIAVTGTIAYFTDTDAQTNTFTVGDVAIDLFEDFNTENDNLIPVVKEALEGEWEGATEYHNAIEKEVYVENTSSSKEPVYVRVHIAVPNIVNGANEAVLQVNCEEESTVDGKWIWGTTVDNNYPTRDNNGQGWNFYKQFMIGNVPYKGYTITYETALEYGDVTCDAINHVYMAELTTQEDIKALNTAYGDEWKKIYVVAEAVQANGFDAFESALDDKKADAIYALNTAFGEPSVTYYDNLDWTAAGKGETFVDRNSVIGE